ncbi:hypothetical protein [Halopiger xanaduensis]|uniref:Uncharacterized protein n=1 Tax=Halopiger xanaduensis (strain DSM 18323 / JCM 14033 / SH-6) TaxID=797210 RepID=F8DA38_HALXS|nr:hypothetical protein [Halopiger xanaduensis]AEH36959.1 hypothetical protein Halxa_2337 [Halopiger xanaduensis SH-6]
MQLLSTDAAGFSGGHLAEGFVSDGHNTIALEDLEAVYDSEYEPLVRRS